MAPFTIQQGESNTLSLKRITEAVIIAMLAAAVTTWGTVQVLSVRIEEFDKRMTEFDKRMEDVVDRIDRIHRDFYRPRVYGGSGAEQ